MEEFLQVVKNLWEQRDIVDELKERMASASQMLEETKALVIKMMGVMELDKQHMPGRGTISRLKNYSVQVPKLPEDKALLFHWIIENKGQDVYDKMISINSQSLNSFYKSELEIAKAEGNINFALPGIKMPEVYWTIGMRK